MEHVIQGWTEEHGIDLFVVGTRGWRGLSHLLLGSTAEQILRNSVCPVLTVGPNVARLERDPQSIGRILFVTDLTQQTEYAVSYALSFAHADGAHLTLLHVLGKDSHVPDRMVASCERELHGLLPSDAGQGRPPQVVVTESDAAREILNFAKTKKSDLIVWGLPKNKRFSPRFHSGVTYSVVSGAPCPVLTVREMLRES